VQPSSISVIATWSVETLHHRNAEMRNCESALWISAWSPPVVTSSKSCREELEETSSISEFGTWRVETLHHRNRNAEMPKCEMAKSTRDPVLVIQRCWILGNLIEGLLLLFTVNRSVMIQLAELNHDSWTVGDSVADAFSWRFTV
jgi:hypothetical protein